MKPAADWSVWSNPDLLNDDGSYSQDASITYYLGDVGGSSVEGEVIITWVKQGEEMSSCSQS